MNETAPKSVELFVNSLTRETGAKLELEMVEAVYVVYCEAVGFNPVDLVDLRQNLEYVNLQTEPGAVLGRSWDGLGTFFRDNRDAIRAVETAFHPDNPGRPVQPREYHVHEYARKWLNRTGSIGEADP